MEISPDVFAKAVGDAYKAGQENSKFDLGYKEGQRNEVTRIAAALKRKDTWQLEELLDLIGAK
jgi:hypothetical protein